MKTYRIFLCLTVLLSLLLACNKKKDEANAQKIGITKIVSHPALDAIEQNIIAAIEQGGREVEFNLQNANGEASAANSIAQLFQNEGVDVTIGIATPTSQALVQNISDIPIFYSAVTDPEDAGLFSKRSQGMKITGYSDLTPVSEHIATIKRIQPDLKVIGQIYSSDEDNARVLNELTDEAASEQDIELVSIAVNDTAGVRDAALSIVDMVDAFYITVDNKVISALAAISEVADQAQKPLYTADPSSAPDARVSVAMGFDYASMGRATGELIVRYLDGDQSVFDNPVNYQSVESQVIYIDQDQIEKLGLSIPEDIAKLANQ